MTKETGGSAFPQVEEVRIDGQMVFVKQTGMTLRDYFAGQALMGMLADHTGIPVVIRFSQIAYEIADAMLQERNK